MNEQIKITLNGKEIATWPGQTILEVAKKNGINIPTLCHDNRLKPFTSCFICVVEVENATNLLPACSTQITEGMAILTNSKKVIQTRKLALDLLLSDHSGDCVAPCITACPAHIDVQGYIAHIANGDYQEAVRLIKKRLPLPFVCGTVCPHPCEDECRRELVEESVAIRSLKKFVAEYDLKKGAFIPKCLPATGKRVDIIGGGPAGLSAAYFLRQEGHEVHIHEALPNLGGMARYGIPKFRLPWDKLDAEIKSIIDTGINVHTDRKLGRDFSLTDLKKEGADAVLLAVGVHASKPMRVENENATGVIGGIEFLRNMAMNIPIETPKNIAVIGGGDVAMDCARVAKRMNSDITVTILYRRTQNEMPALPHEQQDALEDGVEFKFLTAPISVLVGKTNKASGLTVTKMKLGEPDSSGRRRPVPIEGGQYELEFDLVISAIGQDLDSSCLEMENGNVKTTKWNTIQYNEKNMTTPLHGVFAAGDCSFGANTVVNAIGEAYTASKSISMFLQGAKIKFRNEYSISKGKRKELTQDDFYTKFEHRKRATRTNIELNEAQIIAESTRCIECGCSSRYDCGLRNLSTEYNATETRLVGKKRKYDQDKRDHFIKFEADKCITCGSCVRICRESRKISALSFVNRGFETKITPSFETPLQETDCDSCGMCIDVCPTGAISENTGKKHGPWNYETTITTCTSCGRGCAIEVKTAANKIISVSSVDNDPVNQGFICSEGRFSHLLLDKHQDNKNDTNIELAKKLIGTSKEIALLISPKMTIEDIFIAHKFCQTKNAELFYHQSQNKEVYSPYPYSKLCGEINIAFLKKLGAKNWEAKKFDCIILLGTKIKNPNKIPTITLDRFADKNTGIEIRIADQLEIAGSFLNNDGKLAFLDSKLRSPYKSCHFVLSHLGDLNNLDSIDEIRKLLISEVPEFENLLTKTDSRLVDTNLKPEIAQFAIPSRLER